MREAEEFGLDFRFGGSAKITCCGSLDLKATNRLQGERLNLLPWPKVSFLQETSNSKTRFDSEFLGQAVGCSQRQSSQLHRACSSAFPPHTRLPCPRKCSETVWIRYHLCYTDAKESCLHLRVPAQVGTRFQIRSTDSPKTKSAT